MQRLISLDFFRGLTIALMIVVNMPGSWQYTYAPLRHANWHGMTPTDLVFPFFLFIVGVSIALAYSKKQSQGIVDSGTYRKIWIRTFKIFFLGILLALFPEFNFAELRVAGVLQRIALVFLVCSLVYLKTNWRTQLNLCLGLLIIYWLMMMYFPVPGLGAGILEPGENLAAYVDSYLVPGRMYRETWDPEGLFSTLPAIATGLSGMLAGHIILSKTTSLEQKILWLFFAGFVGFMIGQVWSWFFPLNKHLWTSSYVLVTSGLATLFLASSMWIMDVRGYKKWTLPGVVFGMNAITAYVLHGILWHLFNLPVSQGEGIRSVWMKGLTEIGFQAELVSLLWALLYTGLCYLFVLVLYRKKIFIKL